MDKPLDIVAREFKYELQRLDAKYGTHERGVRLLYFLQLAKPRRRQTESSVPAGFKHQPTMKRFQKSQYIRAGSRSNVRAGIPDLKIKLSFGHFLGNTVPEGTLSDLPPA